MSRSFSSKELHEDHAVAVSHHDATHISEPIEHHVHGRNCLITSRCPARTAFSRVSVLVSFVSVRRQPGVTVASWLALARAGRMTTNPTEPSWKACWGQLLKGSNPPPADLQRCAGRPPRRRSSLARRLSSSQWRLSPAVPVGSVDTGAPYRRGTFRAAAWRTWSTAAPHPGIRRQGDHSQAPRAIRQ